MTTSSFSIYQHVPRHVKIVGSPVLGRPRGVEDLWRAHDGPRGCGSVREGVRSHGRGCVRVHSPHERAYLNNPRRLKI